MQGRKTNTHTFVKFYRQISKSKRSGTHTINMFSNFFFAYRFGTSRLNQSPFNSYAIAWL